MTVVQRSVFAGEPRQLAAVRRWLVSVLPPGPALDDVVLVATELASNAICHTASGQGGSFTVEVTWLGSLVRIAVADGGGPTQPRVIDEPDGERGRGLLLVSGLSVRTGTCGGPRGRCIWAEVAWAGTADGAALDGAA